MPAASIESRQAIPGVDPEVGSAHAVRLRDGRAVLIRPARRSDAEQVQAFIGRLSTASRYQRFFLPYRELPPSLLERIVDDNRQRGVSLVALAGYDQTSAAVVALAQYAVDNGSEAAEVGVVVGERWRRAGLATVMLSDLAESAAANGVAWAHAEILRDNTPALRLAARFGAYIGRGLAGASAVRASRALIAAQASLKEDA